MKVIPYIVIALLGFYVGYKLSQVVLENKNISQKYLLLTNEIKRQVEEIEERLKISDLDLPEKEVLNSEKIRLQELLR